MEIETELTAKIIGEIIAKGMNISDFDIKEKVSTEATCVLNEIRIILKSDNVKEKEKLDKISGVIERHSL